MSAAEEIYQLNLKFDKFFDVEVTLTRMLSPLTCEALISALPKTGLGWTARQGSGYYMIQLELKKGTEKATKEIQKGDVVYSPREDSLLLVFDEKAVPPSAVNKLGKITSNLDALKTAKRGINVTITQK